MIFRRHLAEKVLAGEKTVTRRLPNTNPRSPWWIGGCAYQAGNEVPVRPGRTAAAIGRAVVTDARLEPLGLLDADEARREGCSSAEEFAGLFRAINGSYDPTALVWRVAFRPAGPLTPDFELVGGHAIDRAGRKLVRITGCPNCHARPVIEWMCPAQYAALCNAGADPNGPCDRLCALQHDHRTQLTSTRTPTG